MTISQPKSNEEEISLRFQAAIEKLDRVEADAEKEKTQIVQDLAKDLEGKIATDAICNEIVHQLHGKKISPRTIRKCLDEKYKEKHRVENARKQKRHENTVDLAASVPLNDRQEKVVVIDTFGNEMAGPQSSVIKAADHDNDKAVVISQNSRRYVAKCEDCQIKDSTIEQLEEALRKTAQMTPADQIAELRDNEIINLQKELDRRTQELEYKTSQYAKLSEKLSRQKDENTNAANVPETKSVDFEFSLLLGDVKYHIAALYPQIGDAGKVWISGKFDKDNGNIHSIRFGRIGDNI